MFVTSSRIICTAEKHSPGKILLQVTVNGADYTTEGLVLEYLADIGVQSLTPSTGSNVGRYTITVQGSGLKSRLSLVCLFRSLRSKALFLDTHFVVCEVPKVDSDQSVRVRVVAGAHRVVEGENHGVLSELGAAMSVHTLLPSVGLSGRSSSIFVVGTAFRAGPKLVCKFGDVSSKSVYMSSSLILCHVPSLSPGETSVQVSFDGATYMEGPEFRVIDKIILESITPSKGPILGSNFITLHGAGFQQSDAFACVFGDISDNTQGQVVSSSKIVCAVPKMSEVSSVSLSVLVHDVCCLDGAMSYEVVAPAVATSLFPSTGRLLGGTTITVHGQGFAMCGMSTQQ